MGDIFGISHGSIAHFKHIEVIPTTRLGFRDNE